MITSLAVNAANPHRLQSSGDHGEASQGGAGFFQSAEFTERTEKTESTEAIVGEESECVLQADPPELGVYSEGNLSELERAIEIAIVETQPKREGERNRKIFEFARAIKGIPALANCPTEKLRPHVERWYRLAYDVIGTKTFVDTWIDFCNGLGNVLYPKGEEPMELILESAKTAPIPSEAFAYDAEYVRRLVAICHALQVAKGSGKPFYLACRTAQRIIGMKEISHTRIAQVFKMLTMDGVLKVVTAGGPHTNKATRYLYMGKL